MALADKTTYAPPQPKPRQASPSADIRLTVFDGGAKQKVIDLTRSGSERVSFGRGDGNDVIIPSATRVVSRNHGYFSREGDGWYVTDLGSTNGTRINGSRQKRARIVPGDIVTIGKMGSLNDCVIIAVGRPDTAWTNFPLQGRATCRIGRNASCDLVLSSPVVSNTHATILQGSDGSYAIRDENSYNGTYVMGRAVHETHRLRPGDIISIALSTLIFTGSSLLYSVERRGVEVIANDLVQLRKDKDEGWKVTTNHVSLRIKRGSFTAIVGGSGSGKSTLLNALNGSDPAKQGQVLVDGIDLYPNYNYLKNAIGYVPQQDIVHDDLTLEEMLGFAAELRMPPDSTKAERAKRCEEVMGTLELLGSRNTMVGSLSGGQKKRASIAVELLADSRLLYLDEPTSGLDPGMERSFMRLLSNMAHNGRTIVLVTHTTLNLHLCDQVVFLAPGGGLCFEGAPQDAKRFFGVDDFVPIYDLISKQPERWVTAFANQRDASFSVEKTSEQIAPKKNPSFFRQVSILSRRYTQLIFNDRQRLALLLLQAPILAALICLVAGRDCFVIFERTKSCLFSLSCAAFWVGILDSIQEICKERHITRREYGGGLKISAYVISKLLVLGMLCVIQSLEICGTFIAIQGPSTLPQSTVLLPAALELFVTMTLLTLSAMCLGLFISALFSNPDRAIAVAPMLIMPQVLFSGLVFELKGISKTISTFVNCRWSMEALGTTANLNELDLSIYGEKVTVPASTQVIDEITVTVPETSVDYMGSSIPVAEHEETLHDLSVDVPKSEKTISKDMLERTLDDAFLFTSAHLLFDWGVLVLFCVVCTLLCAAVLRANIRK